jgi:hypothetical protein
MRIELSLLSNLRKEIVIKRAKLDKEITQSKSKNLSRLVAIDKMNKLKEKKIDQDKKKETRAIAMVVTNSILNFVLRFPEILILISSNSDFLQFIFNAGSMSVDISANLVSFSYFAYILIFSLNVVVYYTFNPKFKKLFIFWPHFVKNK